MYSNVKSTGLPLGLFSTLMFSGEGVYIGVGFGFGGDLEGIGFRFREIRSERDYR